MWYGCTLIIGKVFNIFISSASFNKMLPFKKITTGLLVPVMEELIIYFFEYMPVTEYSKCGLT